MALSADFNEALQAEDNGRIEELFLERLALRPIPAEELAALRLALRKGANWRLLGSLVELESEALEESGQWSAAVRALADQIDLDDHPGKAMLERLEIAVRKAYAESASLDKVLDKFDLRAGRRVLDTLETVELWLRHDVGTPVEIHRQGVGRVLETNLKLNLIKVQPPAGRPMSVPINAVRKHLTVLEKGTFLRVKVDDREGLSARCVADPGACLVHFLESCEDPVNASQIKVAILDLLGKTSWSSWWNKARKHPRLVTSGSGSRLRYAVGDSEHAATDAIAAQLTKAAPRARLQIARRLAERSEDAAEAAAAILAESLEELKRDEPGLAFETASLVGDLGLEKQARAAKEVIFEAMNPLLLLRGVHERGLRAEILESVREGNEDWPSIWAQHMVIESQPSLLLQILDLLISEERVDLVDEALETIFRAPEKYPGAYVWALEMLTDESAPEVLTRRFTASVLERLPDTLTRAEFAPLRSRAKALFDGGQVAIRLILEHASETAATRFASRIGRIDVLENHRRKLVEQAVRQISKASDEPTQLLVASRAAVEGKREELRQLVEIEIPKTLKGINAAAAEGDLRENFEYHMLRDRQELQSARAAKLQEDLGRVRILEPGAAQTTTVNIGCIVAIEGETGRRELTILGPWDADTDNHIYADGTELAQALLGKAVGDEFEFGSWAGTIVEIRAWS